MNTTKLILAVLLAAVLTIICPMAFGKSSNEARQNTTFADSFLDFSGVMTIDDEKVSDYTVYIFQDGSPSDTFHVRTQLEQHYLLPVGHNYTLKFTKFGYKDRLVLVNTTINSKRTHDLYTFRYSVEFIADGESNTADDFPVAFIHYDETKKDFDYNREYHTNIRTDNRPRSHTVSKSWH